ncbi:PAS domain S-box protein [Euzebyella marina]|uniref:histidine kinase n=1 Tax=Euzebyella marina TaxID=1761453 RepID=A0A3G2L9W4_9FLAO|nr:PAS domain-containing protein [Euzebyella marina]AYN69034.1 PAS domain S-box protein [Euzebyella marina]
MLQEIDFKNLQKEINKVAKIGVFYVDLATEESFWDQVLKDIFEIAPDFVPYMGASDQFFNNPTELENKHATYRKSLSEGTPFEMVNQILTAKGNRKYIRTFGLPVMKDGHCIALSGKVMDITNQKETERDLIQIKEQWDLAEELVSIGYWQWNVQNDHFQCSDNLRVIYGIDVGTKINLELILEKVCDEDKELFSSNIKNSLKNKYFETFTYTICTTEKEIRFLRANGKVISNESGHVIAMMGTTQDITEDVTTQKELKLKNEQLLFAEELAKVGYVHWNVIGDESYWSNNVYRIYGIEIGEKITFEKFMSIVHPDDIQPLQARVEKIIETGNFQRIVHRTIPINGTIKTVEILGKVVKGENGETIELKSSIHDITEQVARENDLIEKTQLMDFGEQLANIAYWQWDVVRDRITCSDNLYHIHGYPHGIFLNKQAILKSMPPEDRDMVAERLKKYLATGNFEKFTHRILQPTKRITTVQVMGKAFKDKAGKVFKILGVTRDITEQIKKEQLLIEKNQQLLYAEKMAKIGNWRWNSLTNEVIWSDNLYEIYGHDKSEPVTFEKYIGYIHKEDRDYVTAKIDRAVESGVYEELIYRIELTDETIKTIKSIGSVTIDEAGRTIEMLGTCQDVTDQILREKELTEKNMQLSFAEEMAGIGYWNWNLENSTVKWSDNLYRIFGFELGIPLKFEDVFAPIHPDDKAHVQKATEEIISSRIFAPIHYRIVLQDGSIRNIELFGKVMTDTKNQVVEVMGTAQDITESTKIQEALVQKNQQLNSAEKIAEMGHWTLDPFTKKATWSDNLYEIYGIEKGTSISNENFIDFIHEDDREVAKAKILKIIGTKKFEDLVYRIRLEKGLVKTIRMAGKVITDPKGNIVELLGTCQDISEQIAREHELMEKNQMMAFAEELSGIGYWKWDIINDVMDKSDNLMRILDFELGTPMNFKKYLSRVHPKDQDLVIEKSQLIEETKKFEKFTHRIIKLDGSIRTLEITGEIVLDEKGGVTELIGSSNDITDRINDEQALIEQNQLLNLAEELSGIGHWKWNMLKSKFEISENFYRILDLDPNKPMDYGKFMNCLPLEDREYVTNTLYKILQNKTFDKFAHRIIKKDGSFRNLEVVGEVLTDKNGIVELIGTAQDVTERRMAEKKFRGLLDSAPDAIVILNNRGKIKIVNKEAEKLLGYTIKELLNKHISFVTPTKFKNLHKEYAAKFFNNPNQGLVIKNQELYIKNKSGGQIPVQVSIGPVETAEGLMISIAIRDITLRKEAESKLVAMNNRLKDTAKKLSIQNQQLSDFNHITSHNLRSPVSNLNALLKLLQVEKDDVRKSLLFEKFEKVIDHLSSTLDTLVETLRIKSETAQNQTKISFEKVLTKTKDILTAQIMDSGAEIISNFSKASKIEYNEVYLESIFLNLVSNAIKYKSPLRPPVIHIESWVEDGKTKLKVADNGLGIDLKKNGKKLFGLNKVFHRHPEAKGVGLFLTKAQVEAMGGTITAESEVNVGTTFLITLD